MVVQAQALGAKAAVETAPDLAADAGRRSDIVQTAGTIAELGRDAMSEMHRTLALMRPSGSEPERAPPPTLDGIDRLLEQARSAGVPVQLHVRGEPRTLEPSLELSAYRIVQEALTNVVKHAGSARTEVTVRYGPTELELEVIDEGPNVSPAGDGSGHGLIGMRERAALFGGELYAGPRPAGGYRVAGGCPTTGC